MQKLAAAIKKIAIEMILNESTKDKIISNLNKKLNLPMISEQTEKELLEALYEAMQESLKSTLEDEK
tara:strand:- start:222 stop:422 length:201 start_codon:yes stop_codon:yes gene_type:complete